MAEHKEIEQEIADQITLSRRSIGNFNENLLNSLKQKCDKCEDEMYIWKDKYIELEKEFEAFKKSHGLNINAIRFVPRRHNKSPLTLLQSVVNDPRISNNTCDKIEKHLDSIKQCYILLHFNKSNIQNAMNEIVNKITNLNEEEINGIYTLLMTYYERESIDSKHKSQWTAYDLICEAIYHSIQISGRINVTNQQYWISLDYFTMHIFDVVKTSSLQKYFTGFVPLELPGMIINEIVRKYQLFDNKQQFDTLRIVISLCANTNAASEKDLSLKEIKCLKPNDIKCIVHDICNDITTDKTIRDNKESFLSYFNQSDIDGNKLMSMKRKHFSSNIIRYCNNKKLSGPSKKLWKQIHLKIDENKNEDIDEIDAYNIMCAEIDKDEIKRSDENVTIHRNEKRLKHKMDETVQFKECEAELIRNPSIFISKECTQKAIDNQVIAEKFETKEQLYHHLKWNGKMHEIDGYYKTFSSLSDGTQIIIDHTELHNANNDGLYRVAATNKISIKSYKWEMEGIEGFMTANQIYKQYGIKQNKLPFGSRANSMEYKQCKHILSAPYTDSTINNKSINIYCDLKTIKTKQLKEKRKKKENKNIVQLSSMEFHKKVCESNQFEWIIEFNKDKTEWIIRKLLLIELSKNNWITLQFDNENNPLSLGIDCNDIKTKLKLFDPSINLNEYRWLNNDITHLIITKHVNPSNSPKKHQKCDCKQPTLNKNDTYFTQSYNNNNNNDNMSMSKQSSLGSSQFPTMDEDNNQHQTVKDYISNLNENNNNNMDNNINNNNNNHYKYGYNNNYYNNTYYTFNGTISTQQYRQHNSYKQKRDRNNHCMDNCDYYSSKTNYKSSYRDDGSNRRSNHNDNGYGSNSKKRDNYGY